MALSANNTLSKIYPGGEGVEWQAFAAKRIADEALKGVVPFQPRRLGPDVDDEARIPTASPEPVPAAPAVDVEAVRKKAFQEGFQAGADAAEKSARDSYEKALAGLRGAASAFEQARPALMAEAQAELVDLAFAIARRVLRREIGVDPNATRAIASACMAEAGGAPVKKIWVHPDDVDSVREGVGPGVEVAGDETMTRGGAVIETERGRLDGSIEAQLDEIAKGLADG